MSQRAIINCRRCCEIARMIIGNPQRYFTDEEERKKALDEQLFADNDLYFARNEALRALEDAEKRSLGYTGIDNLSKIGEYRDDCHKAADACVECDYSSPRIADRFLRFEGEK